MSAVRRSGSRAIASHLNLLGSVEELGRICGGTSAAAQVRVRAIARKACRGCAASLGRHGEMPCPHAADFECGGRSCAKQL